MSSETLEKVKIEIRSILLSSKHGVASDSIENDYEMLMCQRLPLKELGFKNVLTLMRSMPDVAKEVSSHIGGITYHAVCDESTAHIKKLVSKQNTKKKKYPAKKGKKHDTLDREGASGKGGQPSGRRGSLGGRTEQSTTKSRVPVVIKSDHSEKTALASSDCENKRSEQWQRVTSLEHDVSSTDVKLIKFSKKSRTIVGRGPLKSSSQSNADSCVKTSPKYNLKIRVSKSGKREVLNLKQPLQNKDVADSEPASQGDLRDFVNKRLACSASLNHNKSACDNIDRRLVGTTESLNSVVNKEVGSLEASKHQTSPQMKENRAAPKKRTPKLQRHQHPDSTVQDKPGSRSSRSGHRITPRQKKESV